MEKNEKTVIQLPAKGFTNSKQNKGTHSKCQAIQHSRNIKKKKYADIHLSLWHQRYSTIRSKLK